MPTISNAMLKDMIETLEERMGTLEKRMDIYEKDIKDNRVILRQIESYSKFIVAFLKWIAGILALIIAGLVVAWLSHMFH